jgi:hypothetical protein
MENNNLDNTINIAVNANGNVSNNALNYDADKKNLVDNLKLTTTNNSLIFEFDVAQDKCTNSVVEVKEDGSKVVLTNKTYPYDNAFRTGLLEPFIEEFIKNSTNKDRPVMQDSPIPDTYSFRMVSDGNDMVSINGIDLDYSNKLAEQVSNFNLSEDDKNVTVDPILVKKYGQAGIGSTVAIILVVVLIAVTLVGAIYFTVASR